MFIYTKYFVIWPAFYDLTKAFGKFSEGFLKSLECKPLGKGVYNILSYEETLQIHNTEIFELFGLHSGKPMYQIRNGTICKFTIKEIMILKVFQA